MRHDARETGLSHLATMHPFAVAITAVSAPAARPDAVPSRRVDGSVSADAPDARELTPAWWMVRRRFLARRHAATW